MKQLFLEALDVWLFRDGRPFDALSDHRAESLFPPYPKTIQGMIRSHYLMIKRINLHDKQMIADTVGTTTDFKTLRLRGPFLAQRYHDGTIERYFPLPADVTYQNDHFWSLRPQAVASGILTSAAIPMLLLPKPEDKPQKSEFNLWLSETDLQHCLEGRKVTGIPTHNLFVRENRFGIGLNDAQRVTQEGALYEVEFIRPCPGVGLLIEIAGYNNWPDSGILRSGGEGRGARFTSVPVSPWPVPSTPLPACFKVYFATPTYFDSGWQPQDWGKFFKGEISLQAVALPRYDSVGGFDWASNDHKPARRYVPAGSVYYFQSKGQVQLNPNLTQNAITDFGAEIGFGQILIKEW